MEVSAKTGHNVKEFFKDLAFMTAGGKKGKDEPPTKQGGTDAPQNNQSVTLNTAAHKASGEEKAKKSKCC